MNRHSVSEKRSRLYETLTETTQQTKRQKTSDAHSNTTSSSAVDHQHSTDKSSKTQKQPVKHELRSSNATKKISDLATTKLNLPTYNEVE